MTETDRYIAEGRQIVVLEQAQGDAQCDHLLLLRQFNSQQSLLPCAWPECKGENAGPDRLRVVQRMPTPRIVPRGEDAIHATKTEDYVRLRITSCTSGVSWIWVRA